MSKENMQVDYLEESPVEENLSLHRRKCSVQFSKVRLIKESVPKANSQSSEVLRRAFTRPLKLLNFDDGLYWLIGGEFLYSMAKISKIDLVPAIIYDRQIELKEQMLDSFKKLDDSGQHFMNKADALNFLTGTCEMPQDTLAEFCGLAQCSISNKLRLLGLPEDIRSEIVLRDLSEKHARLLLFTENKNTQRTLLDFVCENNLNSRQMERLVASLKNGNPKSLSEIKLSRDLLVKVYKKLPEETDSSVKTLNAFLSALKFGVTKLNEEGLTTELLKRERSGNLELVVIIGKQ